jgi:RHS repeat-associated protein
VLGGQVVAEMNGGGVWTRGFVYLGSQLLAVQQGGVSWMHEDPITKSKRVTNSAGTVVSMIETDPWGAEVTNRSTNAAFQPRKFTSYDRDQNGTDEAMFRRYNRWQSRFDQPDPYDGSYNLSNPQSLNRYAYVQNDPVNLVDPTGLNEKMCRDSLTGEMFPCPDTDIVPISIWEPNWNDLPFLRDYPAIALFFPADGPTGEPPLIIPREPEKPESGPRPDPCVTSPYVNFGLSGGASLVGGNISLLASGRGFYLQLGGGVVGQTRIGAPPSGSRFSRFGLSPTIRASQSGITDGWGSTADFTYYARNYDSNGNLVSQEGGFVGLPGASVQSTYTFRVLNPNGCK